MFVVFRERARKNDSVVLVKRDGKQILSASPEPRMKVVVSKALYGVLDDQARTRDVTAQVQAKADAGEFSFPVTMMAEGGDPAPDVVKTLVVDYTMEGKPFTVRARDAESVHLSGEVLRVTVEKARYGVLDDPKRTRDMREKVQRLVDSGVSSFTVARMAEGDDPAVLVVKTLELDYTMIGQHHYLTGQDPDTMTLAPAAVPPKAVAQVVVDPRGRPFLEPSEPGEYEVVTASGKVQRVSVKAVQPPLEVSGPWQVRFASSGGTPAEVTFDRLRSWSEYGDTGIKYFSGEATYSKTLTVPREMLARDKRLYLDLGKVAVMAEVTLNGHQLGILWKPPFRVDITKVVKPGDNRLEVKVVNLWPNRLIGDEQLPEDSERNPDGTLKNWPPWLLDGKPSPTGRYTFAMWRLWKKNDALLESGLIGPVQLLAAEAVALK